MTTPKAPRPYIDPYLAGALLGLVLFLSYYVTGGGLGASAGFSRVQTGILDWIDSAHVDRIAYFADMAGGSRNPWAAYGVYMVLGAVLGGFLSGLVNRRVKVETRSGPRVSKPLRLVLAFVGGLIMVYGARMARGCTSGQALSGGAVLSVGSWAFMLSLFASGYATAWFARRLWT